MNRLSFIISVIFLTSCTDKRVTEYELLVDRADKMIITKREQYDSIVVSTSPLLQNLKEVLKRKIKPEGPRKFIVDRAIALYEQEKRIGLLMLSSGEKPYVNFRSDSINFSFPLTYGIGMSLSEHTSENSR